MKMTDKVDKLKQIKEILKSIMDILIDQDNPNVQINQDILKNIANRMEDINQSDRMNQKEQYNELSLIREARLSIDRLDKEINKRLDTLRELSIFSKDILNKGFYSIPRIDKIIKHYLEKIIYHSNNLCEYLKELSGTESSGTESSGTKGRYSLNTVIEMEMIYLYFIDLYNYLGISNDSHCSSDESDYSLDSLDSSDESSDESDFSDRSSDESYSSDGSEDMIELVRHYSLSVSGRSPSVSGRSPSVSGRSPSDSDKDHELITEIWNELGNPEFTDFDTFWDCYYKKVRRRVISQIKDEFYHILRDIVDYPRDNVITLNKLKRTALFGLDPVYLRFFTYDYGGILGHYSGSTIRNMLTNQIRNGKKSVIFGIAGDRLLPVSIEKKKINLVKDPLGPYRKELIEGLYTGSLKSSDILEKIKSEKFLRELTVNINGTAYKLVPVKYNTDYLVTL